MTPLHGKVALVTGGARGIGRGVSLGRRQRPGDVGQLAVYLAGAKTVTGRAIHVDGGMELHRRAAPD